MRAGRRVRYTLIVANATPPRPSLPELDGEPVEATLELLRQEWRNGCSGRHLSAIVRAVESLATFASAEQSADQVRTLATELKSYGNKDRDSRREMLKAAADQLKLLQSQLRPATTSSIVIGKNPAALRSPRRAIRDQSAAPHRPDEPVTVLSGVGVNVANKLRQLGITTLADVLRHVPRRHIDFSRPQKIGDVGLMVGDAAVTIEGEITEIKTVPHPKLKRVEARLTDGTGWARITWFNPYIAQQIRVGDRIVINGPQDQFRGSLSFTSPEWEKREAASESGGKLIPVYGLTSGIGQKQLRKLTRLAIDSTRATIIDPVPSTVLAELKLVGLPHAIAQRHYPATQEVLEDAIRRLAFDELFLLQIGLVQRKRRATQRTGVSMMEGQSAISGFLETLPFELTKAQYTALRDVSRDLSRETVMHRLIQGDVGSGKTVVAAAAALQAVQSGYQVAVMAPTEILATQLARTFERLFTKLDESAPVTRLLTGSTKSASRREILRGLENQDIDVLVGTHAVIQDGVLFSRLGLTVIDEQHRFGVRQRAQLPSKSSAGTPHILSMSATPIPRSLNLVVMGDLDVSVIDELPPGREPVITRRFVGAERNDAYGIVRSEIAQGRQVFVICPLVEDSDLSDAKAAVSEAARLQTEVFPELTIGVLHGRLSGAEKDRVMEAFQDRQYQILVTTSVIEVGIDVPNATVMMIEGADRFGLAQLHQFRGRVGRGGGMSYCLLLADDASPLGEERLKMMESITDGFVLAEADLRMRGPGDFLGKRQSGLPDLAVLQTGFDTRILEHARRVAQEILDRDHDLALPEHMALRRRMAEFWASAESDLPGA